MKILLLAIALLASACGPKTPSKSAQKPSSEPVVIEQKEIVLTVNNETEAEVVSFGTFQSSAASKGARITISNSTGGNVTLNNLKQSIEAWDNSTNLPNSVTVTNDTCSNKILRKPPTNPSACYMDINVTYNEGLDNNILTIPLRGTDVLTSPTMQLVVDISETYLQSEALITAGESLIKSTEVLNFGVLALNTSSTKRLYISNLSTIVSIPAPPVPALPDGVSVVRNTCSIIPKLASCFMDFKYTHQPTNLNSIIEFTSTQLNEGQKTLQVSSTNLQNNITGDEPKISLSYQNFSDTNSVGGRYIRRITATNLSNLVSYTFGANEISQSITSPFSILRNNCDGYTIIKEKSCYVDLLFEPTTENQQAQLTINLPNANVSQTVAAGPPLVACTVSNSGISNASEVSGTQPSCSVVSCSANYDKVGNSCVAQACVLSDFSNAATLAGDKAIGCSIATCSSNYTLSMGACSPTLCTSSDIENSATVSGNKVTGCTTLTCSSGFSKVGNSCVTSNVTRVCQSQPAQSSGGLESSIDGGVSYGVCSNFICNNNYSVSGSSCIPTLCTTADVLNSASVSGDKTTACVAESCISGFSPVGGSCVTSNITRACQDQPSQSTGGLQSSTDGGVTFGVCANFTCNTNYEVSSNSCAPQSCNLGDYPGAATISGNKVTGCVVDSCSSAFQEVQSNSCVYKIPSGSIAFAQTVTQSQTNNQLNVTAINTQSVQFYSDAICSAEVGLPLPLSSSYQMNLSAGDGIKDTYVKLINGNQMSPCYTASIELDAEIDVIPTTISLIGSMENDSTGNSFFKIDDNFNISEISTNINQKTRSQSLGLMSFYGNDLLFIMDTDKYGSEVYRLSEGSTSPQLVTYDPSALNRYGSANSPLVIHNGYAYFNSRTIDNSSLRCAAVDLGNYSNKSFFSSSCNNLTVANGSLYATMVFDASTGAELVRLNGLTMELVADINPGALGSSISRLVAVGTDLYFTARNPTVANTPGSGLEIFRYNTITNAVNVYDTIVGATGAVITGFNVYNGNLFFREGNIVKRYNTSNNQVTTIISNGNNHQLDSERFIGLGDSVYFVSNGTSSLGTEVIRHVLSTGVSSVIDLTVGSSSTTPAQIKTDGVNIYARSSSKIFKYTVANQQIQDLDLTTPSSGVVNTVNTMTVDSNNIYYIATQSSQTGFGTEFFKYSISTGQKTFINICDDSVKTCSGALSGFPQDIKIKNNDIYIVGGNNIVGKNEIVKINNVNNTFQIIDANKMKAGIRENEEAYPIDHIIADGKILFSGEDSNGNNKLYVKTIDSTDDAIELNLPTPYLNNDPTNFYQSENYVYFGAQVAQTEEKVFQYNKLTGNIVPIEFPFNQSAQSRNYTTFADGKYYLTLDNGPIYVYDEVSNQISSNLIYITYDPSVDSAFSFETYKNRFCEDQLLPPEELQPCLDNTPFPTPYIISGFINNPVVFHGTLYLAGAIHRWNSSENQSEYVGEGVYRYNPATNTVTLLTPETDGINPNLRFDPLEPINTENHLIWISQSFPQQVFHVYKNPLGNLTEELISFMDTVFGSSSFPVFAIEDSQKDMYFTDPRTDSTLYKLQYGEYNSIQAFAGPGVFDIQQLVTNAEIEANQPIRGISDLGTEILFQYGSKLLKCPKLPSICSVIPSPQGVTTAPIGGLYRLGDSIIYSQGESDSTYNTGDYERKLYRLELDDNSITELLFNGDGLHIKSELKEYVE